MGLMRLVVPVSQAALVSKCGGTGGARTPNETSGTIMADKASKTVRVCKALSI